MATDYKKLPAFVSPKGTFEWPKLTEPDTKFKKEGEYVVKLRLSAKDAAALKAKLQPLHDQSVEDGKAEYAKLKVEIRKKNEFKTVPFFSEVYDEAENETGEAVFKFGMKASGVSEKTGKTWHRKPALFDAKGAPLKGSPQIWNGTIGKVAFEVMPFFVPALGAGLSLRLTGAQIIELRNGAAKSASQFGFGQEEGYSQEDEIVDETGEDTESEAGDDTDDDEEF